MEELNGKLARWLQEIYHSREHDSIGESPQERFARGLPLLRHLDPQLDLDRLFYTRIDRVVRKDGTEGRCETVALPLLDHAGNVWGTLLAQSEIADESSAAPPAPLEEQPQDEAIAPSVRPSAIEIRAGIGVLCGGCMRHT